ncbi:MAG: autoinducer binding domain-containing protein, partial [Oricola sp.]
MSGSGCTREAGQPFAVPLVDASHSKESRRIAHMEKRPTMAHINAPAPNSSQTGFIDRIAACNTSYDILRLVREFAKEHGFDHFTIGRMPGPDDRKLSTVAIVGNWPPELTSKYDEMGYIEKSPIMKAMRKST